MHLATQPLLAAFLLVGVAASTPPAAAQAYPSKPVEIVVPYGAGGSSDIVVRMLQQSLSGKFPQPLVILNKPGAGGALGSREVKDSPADGYRILSTHIGLIINQVMKVSSLGPEDFKPIAEVGRTDLVFAVPKDSPYKTFGDVIRAAKAKPNTITHATNLGSVVHFTTLGITKATGAAFRLVQVGGGGERLPMMVGNQVETALFGVSEALPYHQSGALRILAILTAERWPALPDVPTAKELGFNLPEPTSLGYWYFAPKDTPDDRIKILGDAIEAVMAGDDMKAKFRERGFAPSFLRGDAFKAVVVQNQENIKRLSEEFGVAKK